MCSGIQPTKPVISHSTKKKVCNCCEHCVLWLPYWKLRVLCVSSLSVHNLLRVTGNALLEPGNLHYLTPTSAIFALSMHLSSLGENLSGDSGSYSSRSMADEASLLATRNCKDFLETPGGPVLETSSPVHVHSIYYSIVTLQEMQQEVGGRDSLKAMEALSKTLLTVQKRWKVAGLLSPAVNIFSLTMYFRNIYGYHSG